MTRTKLISAVLRWFAAAAMVVLPGAARADDESAAVLRPVTRGRAANLAPVSSGRAAGLSPVTRDRAAGLAPVTRGRAAGLASGSAERAARLAPVTRGRAAQLMPVTVSRAANLPPITAGRAAGLAPVTDGLPPVTEGLAPVTVDRAAGLAPVTDGLAPVTRGRVAALSPVATPEAVEDGFLEKLSAGGFPLLLGDTAFRAGRFEEARLAFEEAARRQRSNPAARFALCDAMVARGEWSRAEESLREGLRLAPAWGDGLDRRRHYGDPEFHDRHLAEAEEAAAAGRFGLLLGWLRLGAGDAEGAAAALRTADPDDAAASGLLERLNR